ncbi:MAG: D-alanine--D-alanine ligase [Aeromicrobium sp.]|nr:MAG: D-alanine--D-alanine ligase [Aeromicrobium sp.]
MSKPTLALIFGGRSSEHGVSCLTAREVLSVIDRDAYDVLTIGITREGRWVRETAEWPELADGSLPEVRTESPEFDWSHINEIDVAFPLLHGPWGEDGTIQGLFEMADIPFVGAGVLASAVGMDKPFTKSVFSAAGLPQLPYVTIQPWEWDVYRERSLARVQALTYPVFVKPARAGSSSGVTRVTHESDLVAAVEAAREHDPKVVVEAGALNPREIECGVIQTKNGKPIASVVGEIVVQTGGRHEYYDFEAKYLDHTSVNVIPADLDPETSERVRAYALQAFDAIGAEGLARVDFFLTDNVDGGLVINEINTMPGFTPYSMFPGLWQASGMSYPELVQHLIELALSRSTGLR